jgi:hypothetical protein
MLTAKKWVYSFFPESWRASRWRKGEERLGKPQRERECWWKFGLHHSSAYIITLLCLNVGKWLLMITWTPLKPSNTINSPSSKVPAATLLAISQPSHHPSIKRAWFTNFLYTMWRIPSPRPWLDTMQWIYCEHGCLYKGRPRFGRKILTLVEFSHFSSRWSN